jgi:vacuolar-type H+-ATPase subunit E/Vma4
MKIELTQAEHGFLATLLEEKQHELLHEISKADVHDFRRGLKEKEEVLETLLRKLAAETVGSTAA